MSQPLKEAFPSFSLREIKPLHQKRSSLGVSLNLALALAPNFRIPQSQVQAAAGKQLRGIAARLGMAHRSVWRRLSKTLRDKVIGPSDRNRTCIWRLGGARSIH
jgi:hypothetical protein